MIQVIQTNQSLNVFGQERDFQSCITEYNLPKIPEYSEWEVFKDYIEQGQLHGFKKKPIEVTINDDFHFEVIYRNNENMFTKTQFYLVGCNSFKREYECNWVKEEK